MKHLYFFLLISFSSVAVNAQTDNIIAIGKIDSVHSKILNEQRKIWMYVPGDGQNSIPSKQRYPVIYLLDGDAHFSSVVGMIQQLGNQMCPEMMVVGIPNTDRMRDLTPTHINFDTAYKMDSIASKNTGGGEKFISFVEKELIPYIDSLYPTESYRMLIGHSVGGLTVINTLLHHTRLFNSYVAIDPSMWWDRKKMVIQSKQILAIKKFPGVSLFLGIANTMEKGMDTITVKKDTSLNTKHIRSILELNGYLNANKQNQLKYDYKYYSNESHVSVPLIAEYDALRFIFNFYSFPIYRSYSDDPKVKLDSLIVKHYKNVSEQMGYSVKPNEYLINEMGYGALTAKQFDKAENLFKMNINYYPQSSNVYDSLGDLYDAKGDKANAIESYKKALLIKEAPETKQKLEKLQKLQKLQKTK